MRQFEHPRRTADWTWSAAMMLIDSIAPMRASTEQDTNRSVKGWMY